MTARVGNIYYIEIQKTRYDIVYLLAINNIFIICLHTNLCSCYRVHILQAILVSIWDNEMT